MRAAYIIASSFFQVAMIGGGATLSYLSDDADYLAGGIFFALWEAVSLGYRLKKWDDDL